MADESSLAGLISNLRKLDKVGTQIAESALPGVLQAAKATAAAGKAPDGSPWPQTKEDGRQALPGAADAISAVVSGATKAVLTLVLKGVYVYHQRSKSKGQKGLPRREILPVDSLPTTILDALHAAARRVVGDHV